MVVSKNAVFRGVSTPGHTQIWGKVKKTRNSDSGRPSESIS